MIAHVVSFLFILIPSLCAGSHFNPLDFDFYCWFWYGIGNGGWWSTEIELDFFVVWLNGENQHFSAWKENYPLFQNISNSSTTRRCQEIWGWRVMCRLDREQRERESEKTSKWWKAQSTLTCGFRYFALGKPLLVFFNFFHCSPTSSPPLCAECSVVYSLMLSWTRKKMLESRPHPSTPHTAHTKLMFIFSVVFAPSSRSRFHASCYCWEWVERKSFANWKISTRFRPLHRVCTK